MRASSAGRSSGRAGRRRCPWGPTWGSRATGFGFSIRSRLRGIPATWLGGFDAAVDRGREVTEEALSCIQQHVDRYRADDFFPQPHDRAALLRFLKPRAGLYARLSEMHDCGLLGRVFPGVPGDFVAGGARLLPQVHGRRAHAADDPEPRAARDTEEPIAAAIPLGARRPPGAGAARPRAAASRRREVARRRPRARERAHGGGGARSAAAGGGAARDGAVPHPASPQDVAGRRSGATPRIPRSSSSSRRWSAPRSASRCCA